MKTISQSIGLFWEALFLQPEPFAVMRDRDNPVSKGLINLIILGLVLALAAFIGSVFTWGSSPDITALQETVLKNLQQMSWWQFLEMDPQGEAAWFQIWDVIWQVVNIANPSPASGLAGFIFTPLSLIASWIIFGLVAHVIAKLFGGLGSLSQTLGTTSLAAAPQLLSLFNVLPFVTLAGVGIWTLLAQYLAIRVAHDLSWGRAFWVTVLTIGVLILILLFLFGAGIFTFAATMSAAFGGGN